MVRRDKISAGYDLAIIGTHPGDARDHTTCQVVAANRAHKNQAGYAQKQ